MSFIWESVPKENINEKIVNDYKTFVFNNLEKDNPIIPTIQVVARYGERDSEIKEAVIKEVLDNPKLSVKFLGDMYHDDGIEEIINFFKNDISALTSIYMSAIEISCEIDYNGKLLQRYLSNSIQFGMNMWIGLSLKTICVEMNIKSLN